MADANDVFAEFNSLGQDNPGGSSDPNDVFDEFNSLGDDQSSAIGAFARGAAKGFLPTVGGVGAGILAGAAATPFTSPVGGIAAGLGAGIATSTAISKAQDYLLDKLGWTDRAQEAADRAQHPIASELGEMAPAALTLRPTGSMLQRAAGAGIGGIAAGANDLLSNGSIDWKHVAEGAGMGAAFPSLNKAGEAIEGVGARLGARLGGKAIPETKSATAGPPPNPEALSDVEEDTAAPPQEPTPQTPPDPELQVAQQQLASLDPEDALYKQWSDYVRGLTERTPDTGSPLYDPDAMLGPAGDENPFTPADSDRANDITTYARGIAAENPPAPQIEGAGNPVGAPMLARAAQRPSGDQRDYRKAAAAFAEVPGESSTPMTTGDQKPDVAAALTVDQPQTGFDQQTVRKPPEPQPAAQPTAEPAVEDAYQQYIREIEQQQGAQARPAEVQGGRQPPPQATPAPQPELAPQGGRRVLPDLTQQPVTAAVTPQQVQQARARLQSLGMDKMLTAFDNSSPEEQAQAVPHILERTATLRKQRVTDTGVAYKDEADRTRKEGSTKAVQTAMDELDNTDLDTEHTPENKKAIIDHATALYERAKELFGGNDPVHPKSGGYYPKVGARTPAQTLVYKARSVAIAKKPSWAQLEEYVTQLQTRGETGANVDAELERKPNRSTDNEGDMAPTSRQEYGATQEMADDHGSAYADQYQELADWMNHLTSDEHAFLAERYDLDAEMADPQDPAELRHTFQQELVEGNRKRPGRIELVPAEEGAGKSTPVRTSADLDRFEPVKPGEAASAPRTIDPNSPEGRAIAMRALSTREGQAPIVPRGSKAENAAKTSYGSIISSKMDAAVDAMKEFAGNDEGGGPMPDRLQRILEMRANGATFKDIAAELGVSTERTRQLFLRADRLKDMPPPGARRARLIQAFKSFGNNEQGGGVLPKAISDWFEPRPMDPSSQHRSDQVKRLLDYVPPWFKTHANNRSWDKGQLVANSMKAMAFGLDRDEWKEIYDFIQQKTPTAPLTGKALAAYNETVKPLLDKHAALYDELYQRKAEDPRIENLPAPHAGFDVNHVPRQKVADPDADPSDINVVAGNSMQVGGQPVLRPREFQGLLNQATGERMVLHNDPETGKFSIWKDKKMRPLNNVPPSFDGNVGDKLPLKVGGKQGQWVVDHASTDEILQHNGTEYQTNPVVALSNSVNQMQSAIENLNTLKKIRADDLLKNNMTTDQEIARKRGYDLIQTKMPPLARDGKGRAIYMPRNLRWMFDDAFHQGFGGPDANWWRSTGTGLARIFMTFGSPIHVANVATNAIIGRGFDNVTPAGLRSLGITGVRAIKAVLDPANSQDYHDFLQAGGRPQYLSTLTNDLMPTMKRRLGADIAQNPAKWDPIGRMWGVSTPDLARAVENFSTSKMWQASDVFALQRFLENRDFKGMSPEDAAADTHQFVPAYDLPSTVGGSGQISRTLSQALADPGVSLFGRYHMDLLRSYGNMVRRAFSPSSTMGDRIKGAGQMLTMAALAYAVYPALDKLVQSASGNDKAEFGRRGMLSLSDAASKLAQGNTDYQRLASNLFTPSVPVNMGLEALKNKDWRGKPIVSQQRLNPAGAARAAGELGEWTAQNIVPPYGQVASALEKPGAGPAAAAGHFAAGMVGAHIPSQREIKYEVQIDKNNQRGIKAREKNPSGPIERGFNALAQHFADGGTVKPQPDITAAVTKGTQLAMRRPIVTTPMPSGADSATNLSGPVYVDPRVPPPLRRPVAVHETVEQLLMSMGMSYPQAHKIATQAEKVAVLRAGGNWERYEAQWRGILDATEKERLSARQTPKGLHVNPMSAIGKSGGGHAVHQER